MKHLGDITKLNGYEIPIVDVICGGSPCQDLSVAGTRSGLDGERSGLFMEQVRIVKEMRERDKKDGRAAELIRPRWMVWENVVGALSSAGKGKPKGADFQAVLTEIVRIVEPDAPDVPMPDKGWPKAGCLYDDMGRWSISWRVHDAQYFGVAQRRRRIALVADFAGLQAPEVLFDPQYRRKTESEESAETVGDTGRKPKRKVQPESESLLGNPDEGEKAGEGTPATVEGSTGSTSVKVLNPHDAQGNQIADSDGVYPTLRGCGGAGYQQGYTFDHEDEPICFTNRGYDKTSNIPDTLRSECHGAQPCIAERKALSFQERAGKPGGGKGILIQEEHVGSIVSQNVQMCLSYGEEGRGVAVDVYNQTIEGDIAPTVTAAVGGTNTSGPKIMSAGFKPRQSAAARTLGYEDELAPTLSTDENYATVIHEEC